MPNPENFTTVKVEVEYAVPDSDIQELVEMAGYGISYWASELTDIDGVVLVKDVEEGGYNGEGDEYVTTYAKLAEVLVKIGNGELYSNVASYAGAYLAALKSTTDAKYATEHIDSDLADQVLQYALFGDVIYG